MTERASSTGFVPTEGEVGVALLFSDVEDSTALFDRLGEKQVVDLWAAHDRHARDLLQRHGGVEVGRSDGVFLLFPSIDAGARYALDYQDTLAGLGLRPRVALHFGTVTLRTNAPDDVARGAPRWEVDGVATPITARLMALARGGQTLLSGEAAAAIARPLARDAELRDHGFYRLKGLDAPVAVHELGRHGRSPFAPPPDVEKAYRVVAEGDLWLPVREVKHNLPQERDPFVGRRRELRWLADELASGKRLVTVQGPGGAGKTRLAARYAWTWLGDWPGGVYFCDLSEARSLDDVLFAISAALSLPMGRGDVAASLGRAIAGRGRCLVMLDNFEQVVDDAAATLARWLEVAGHAAFLVTSRERLNVAGETVFVLDPLPLADDAIELFVRRARAHDATFAVSPAEERPVAEIVRLLDGLPLAIELAAARVRVLAPGELVVQLRHRFAVLGTKRGALARQSTLRAAIDWSWNLLTPAERAALAQASTFERAFTVEALESVLDLATFTPAPAVLDVVQALVDKSLLRVLPARRHEGEPSSGLAFGMLLSIQEYAAERLASSDPPLQRATECRHGSFFARLGSDEAIAALYRHGGIARFRRLADSRENVLVACQRAIVRGDVECALACYAAAWELLDQHGPATLGAEIGARIVAMANMTPAQRLRALVVHATALRRVGDVGAARRALDDALALAHDAADLRYQARVLLALGALQADQSMTDDARVNIGRAQRIAQAIGDRDLGARVCNMAGIVAAEDGQLDLALEHFTSSLALRRALGDRRGEGADMANLANLRRMRGEMDDAIRCFEAALGIAREVGDRRVAGLAIGNLGTLHADLGRTAEARAYCERAIAMHRDVGNRHGEAVVLGTLGKVCAAQGSYDQARTCFADAERLLRELGDHNGVAALLCERAEVAFAAGERDEARQLLHGVAALDFYGAGPGSDSAAAKRFAELRARIG